MSELKPCPQEMCGNNDRTYYMMAGGRIELQSKSSGSSLRLLSSRKRDERCILPYIRDDDLPHVSACLHESIEEYAQEKTEALTAELTRAKQMLAVAKKTLSFYAAIKSHPREMAINTIIDHDGGVKAAGAMAEINKMKE